MEIRRAEVNDIQPLKAFYIKNFPDKPVLSDMEYWEWCYANNPYNPESATYFVVDEDNELGGGIGYMSVKFQVNDYVGRGFHPASFFVLEKYKGLPALRLLRKVTEENDIGYVSYYTDDAKKLFDASRWSSLAQYVKAYYYPLIIEKNKSLLDKLLFVAKKAYRAALLFKIESEIKKELSGDYDVVVMDSFKKTVFEQIESPQKAYHGIVRDLDYIDWRYFKSNRLSSKALCINKDGKCLCAAILHQSDFDNTTVIMDILQGHATDEELKNLLLEIIKYAKTINSAGVSTTFLSKRFNQMFLDIGFGNPPTTLGLMTFSKNKAIRSDLLDPEKWDFWIGHTDMY